MQETITRCSVRASVCTMRSYLYLILYAPLSMRITMLPAAHRRRIVRVQRVHGCAGAGRTGACAAVRTSLPQGLHPALAITSMRSLFAV